MIDLQDGQEWIIDMVNNVLIEVMASFAEQERRMIKERQAEGIAVAKKKGKHLGRPRISYPKMWEQVYKQWKAGDLTAVKAAETLGLTRCTFYNLVENGKIGIEFRSSTLLSIRFAIPLFSLHKTKI